MANKTIGPVWLLWTEDDQIGCYKFDSAEMVGNGAIRVPGCKPTKIGEWFDNRDCAVGAMRIAVRERLAELRKWIGHLEGLKVEDAVPE